jgi:hypothetical protein
VEKPAKRMDKKKQGKQGEAPQDNVGRVLKTVYDDTVGEDVPQDFLDLLGKLS